MNTITKSEISKRIADDTGISASFCEDVVNELLSSLIEVANDGNKIHIKNFGNFEVVQKKPRPGRDISKNKMVMIPAKRVMKFSSSRSLRNIINNKNI